jgi:hypothetical protein
VRILLDESLPRPFGRLLIGHVVSTVTDEAWTSLTNGALLRQAAGSFDVQSNRFESLEPLVPRALEALRTLKPRTLVRVCV